MRIEVQHAADPSYSPGQTLNIEKNAKANMEELEYTAALENEDTQDGEKLSRAITLVNQAIDASNNHLEFQLHESSGRYQVKVVDNQTDQVIREIPPKFMLDLSARIKDVLNNALGLILDEKI